MSRAEISLFIKRLQLMFDFCCFLSTKINWHFIWWRKTGRRLSLSGCARDTPSSTCSARTLSSKAAKCSYPFSHLERGTLRKGGSCCLCGSQGVGAGELPAGPRFSAPWVEGPSWDLALHCLGNSAPSAQGPLQLT